MSQIKGSIKAPCDGEAIELENVCDEVFSSGVMGEGFAVLPNGKNIFSPVDGKIDNAYKTGHAYSIITDDGLDVLVHIGIDTVELNGEFFEKRVSIGERVKAGDIIAYADTDKIMERGFDPVVIVAVANSDKMHGIEARFGKCYTKDEIMTYFLKEE